MRRLMLTPPARKQSPTEILIGSDLLGPIQTTIDDGSYDKVVVLFDAGIETIAKKVTDELNCVKIRVASGDASKSLSEADRIVSAMLDAGCTRKTLLICIGGGMLTDLGGFVASVFMRGIHCILVPTTLLGMVDAAIGGKTAVNAGSRKNMIGTITQPKAVIASIGLLEKLPAAQLSEGMTEIIKIAAITDKPFFEWLEESINAILKKDPTILEECVGRAIEAKVSIVEQDEHDRDVRLLLNFGHTVGHAVEALSQYEISHGNAVSIGMAAEMKLSGFKDAKRVLALLEAMKLPLEIPGSMKPDVLWKAMQSDKKNDAGVVRMAVPKNLGEGVVQEITQDSFKKLFA